jgi:hypothetical protein
MNFDDIKRAVTSEWLKLILLLIAVIGGWYRFDYRISAMEKLTAQHDQQFGTLGPVIDKLDKTLDRIDQTMRDFPLHRHVNDEDVIYPGDTAIRTGRGNGKR